jgi:hypothetical protein
MSNTRPQSELYREAYERWVSLDAKARMLEDTKSIFFSQLCTDFAGDFPGYSVAKVEQKVKASDRYEQFVRSMVDSRTEANKAKVSVEVARMRYWESTQDRADERFVARGAT